MPCKLKIRTMKKRILSLCVPGQCIPAEQIYWHPNNLKGLLPKGTLYSQVLWLFQNSWCLGNSSLAFLLKKSI